jgi:hypothetical protein
MVVLKALFGLQRSEESGLWSQTGQFSGRVCWPRASVSQAWKRVSCTMTKYLQLSHIDCSQQGRRNAFRASLLQVAHRSLKGMSS